MDNKGQCEVGQYLTPLNARFDMENKNQIRAEFSSTIGTGFLLYDAMKKYMIAAHFICLFASVVSAQTSYSESVEYKARPVEAVEMGTRNRDRKKKTEKKDNAAGLASVTTGGALAGDIIVTIPVAVLDRSGSAVRGLKKEDFSVFVDGTQTPVVTVEQDKEPVTVVLVLDSSPSGATSHKAMEERAAKLVNALHPDMKVMVIDFNSKLNVRSQPTTDRAATRTAIRKVKVGDGTALYSAIHLMLEKVLPQVPGRKVIVLMTDGVDTASENTDFAKSLTEVEKHDVPIYPIYFDTFKDVTRGTSQSPVLILPGFGGRNVGGPGTFKAEYQVGIMYMNDLAKASGGAVFPSEKLVDGTKSLLEELTNRYYVMVTVPRKSSGSRPIRVRVNRPSLAVFARGSFVEK